MDGVNSTATNTKSKCEVPDLDAQCSPICSASFNLSPRGSLLELHVKKHVKEDRWKGAAIHKP